MMRYYFIHILLKHASKSYSAKCGLGCCGKQVISYTGVKVEIGIALRKETRLCLIRLEMLKSSISASKCIP